MYRELNVVDAFHKALLTWSKWIDANVNPQKTTVLFRGYSASHFRCAFPFLLQITMIYFIYVT